MATPIGNLGDLSARARETLASAALIAAEDTRHTGVLLKAFGISTPMISLHDHNEAQRAPQLIERLRGGESVALVSDAGTPAISDPGFDLVRACAAAGIEVVAVPGPCALVAALSIAALPTDRFCFEGFLPARGAARRARLRDAVEPSGARSCSMSRRTGSTRRSRTARNILGRRARRCLRGRSPSCTSRFTAALSRNCAEASKSDADLSRGEIVLVIAGATPEVDAYGDDGHGGALDRALKVLLEELPVEAGGASGRAYRGSARQRGL